jgi:ACS family hexuronate transporter-like MFS transporter
MFASTGLNYMDRQAISLVGPEIKGQYRLDNLGFGWILLAFQLTYAFFQWPAGYLADRLSVRGTYAAAVLWWSLAGIATAFAPTLGILMVLRALLGVGESFNWPCALRVTSGILPPADRSLGNGIFNSGAAIGAVLTPLAVPFLALTWGWRFPFVILGTGGLAWVAAWLLLTRDAELTASQRQPDEATRSGLSRHGALGFSAVVVAALAISIVGWLALPAGGRGAALWWGVATFMIGLLVAALVLPEHSLNGADWASSLGSVVRRPRFWVAAAVGVTINVTWHFLVNWMGIFFQEERQLGLLAGGMVSALPFMTADVGNLGGGVVTRALTRRGIGITSARKLVMVFCLALTGCAGFVGFVESQGLVILLLCMAAMGTAAYMVNYFAFGQDVAPAHTGLVIGYLGGLGNLFAAGFMPLAGWISLHWGFGPNFLIVAVLPLFGLVTLLLLWGGDAVETG